MSDNRPVAEAATNNPAEGSKSEESVEVKSDAKTEAPTEVATADATENTESSSKEATNGSAQAEKIDSSADKIEEKGTNGAADQDHKEEKRGGYKGGRKYEGNDRRNGGSKFGQDKRAKREQFDDLPETDDPQEIRGQVEFYFSIQNLATDKHLFHELEGPKNRPVSIKHISQFKRMRRFTPYSAIVNALRESEDLVVVDDGEFSGAGNEAVKRKEPLVCPKRDEDEKYPPDTDELFHRMLKSSINKLENSIYVKGFAGEGEDVGQISLEQFFKPYGAVMIRKRRDDYGNWKGSIFVEFDSEDSQQQYLALDPKPKFNDNELTIMSKKDYSEMKCKEKGITPAWLRNEEYTSARGGHRDDRNRGGRGRGRGGRGSRGGRGGGRYNDRSDRRDHRRRDRSRSRSRGRRDRSDSRSSEDSRDWNGRRDRFQKSRDFKGKNDKRGGERRKSIERDAHGVPVVQDTRTEEEKMESKKRKGDAERDDSPKRSKIEIKEDE